MIIHTSLRIDIPAFYSEWFTDRIREGYVLVRVPYNPLQVTEYSRDSKVVDLIVFCSKNPNPIGFAEILLNILVYYNNSI